MDEKSLTDLFSQFFSDEKDKNLTQEGKSVDQKDAGLVTVLKILAGQSGGTAGDELNQFLGGQGALMEATRSAVTRGTSAASEVKAFLIEKLNLSPSVAGVVAPLLIKLFPSVGMLAGAASTPKPKTSRKKKASSSSTAKSTSKAKKRKTTSSTKPAASSKTKKRKTTSSSKPAASKPKKPASTTSKKTTSRRTKKSGRALEIPLDEDAGKTPVSES
jgi:hypothetical protein